MYLWTWVTHVSTDNSNGAILQRFGSAAYRFPVHYIVITNDTMPPSCGKLSTRPNIGVGPRPAESRRRCGCRLALAPREDFSCLQRAYPPSHCAARARECRPSNSAGPASLPGAAARAAARATAPIAHTWSRWAAGPARACPELVKPITACSSQRQAPQHACCQSCPPSTATAASPNDGQARASTGRCSGISPS